MTPAPATVYLVGAGPGAPDLITVRGLAALQRADVVLYDRLVHPSLLDQAPPGALRVYAGRAPGDPAGDRQACIHDQLVTHARAGRTVVRLKGGDPFVFGRGGEELLALAAAGVPCEVIPGVSSVTAVPALAGIPLTHRGLSTAFGVFTGHDAAEPGGASTDWAMAARMPTAIVLMGAVKLAAVIALLVAHGRAPDTPAIAIEQGSLPGQRVHGGTLAELAHVAADVAPPAILVVGDVVTLRTAAAGGAP